MEAVEEDRLYKAKPKPTCGATSPLLLGEVEVAGGETGVGLAATTAAFAVVASKAAPPPTLIGWCKEPPERRQPVASQARRRSAVAQVPSTKEVSAAEAEVVAATLAVAVAAIENTNCNLVVAEVVPAT